MESQLLAMHAQLRDLRAKAATDAERDFDIEASRRLLGHATQEQTADYIGPIKGQAAKSLQKVKRQKN